MDTEQPRPRRLTEQPRPRRPVQRIISSQFGPWKLQLVAPDDKQADQGREEGDWLFGPLDEFKNALTEGEKRARSGDTTPCIITSYKNFDCFVSEDEQIGFYFRWMLALNLLVKLARIQHPDEWSERSLAQQIRKVLIAEPVGAELERAHEERIKDDFNDLFTAGRGGKRTRRDYATNAVLEYIIAALNRYLPARYTRLEIADFLNTPTRREGEFFDGSRLDDFDQFMLHGVLPPSDNLACLKAEYLILSESPGDPRKILLDETIKWLACTPSTHLRAVVNVYGHDVWQGLRAFATQVLYSLKTGAAKPCRLVYLNVASEGELGDLPGLRRIAAQLKAMCGVGWGADTERDDKPFNLSTDLEGVRVALTLYPTIIVVDGIDNTSGELVEIHDLIRNAQIAEMLRVLMLPTNRLGPAHGPAAPSKRRLEAGGTEEQVATSFLVLSAAPVKQLKPWIVWSEALPKPADPRALRALVTGEVTFDAERETLRQALGATLPSPSLHSLYQVNAADFDRFRPHAAALGESDLAMLRLAGKAAQQGNAFVKGEIETDRFFDDWLSWLQAERYWDALTLKFCVASINGMRISTLRRALIAWAHLIGDGQPLADSREAGRVPTGHVLQASLAHFLDRIDETAAAPPQLLNFHLHYPELIVEIKDEILGAVPREQRIFESQAFPDDDDDRSLNEVAGRTLFNVRSEVTRNRLAAAAQAMRMRTGPFNRGDDEWRAINYLLAEESLSQATSQFRNQHGRALMGIYARGRLVQSIMHGLISLAQPRASTTELRLRLAAPSAFALPDAPILRYRFLYNFLYKRLLENVPDWSLSRGYGRPQLKCVLLKMFVDPAGAAAHWRDANIDGDGNWAHCRLDPNDYTRDAPAFHRELLVTLAYAALDSEDFALVERVLKKIGDLPAPQPPHRAGDTPLELRHPAPVALRQQAQLESLGQEMPVGAALDEDAYALGVLHGEKAPAADARDPWGQIVQADESLNKITIDLAQARGQSELAAELCIQWFRVRLRRDYRLATDFTSDKRLRAYANLQHWGGDSKARLDGLLASESQRLLEQCSGNQQRKCVADALFRLAESRAVQADMQLTEAERFPSYLKAYAIYFIADRVRVGNGGHGDNHTWHTASSKPMRYWVRVCLKLAKIVRQFKAEMDGWRAFYAHAKAISNFYTRHLYHLPRERIGMLLLQASIARVWAELNFRNDADRVEQYAGLEASQHYIEAAESLAIELGFPTRLLRRLFVERAKTMRRLVALDTLRLESKLNADEAQITRYNRTARLAVAERDLALLAFICQGNPYWQALLARQREGLSQTAEALARSSKSPFDVVRMINTHG